MPEYKIAREEQSESRPNVTVPDLLFGTTRVEWIGGSLAVITDGSSSVCLYPDEIRDLAAWVEAHGLT